MRLALVPVTTSPRATPAPNFQPCGARSSARARSSENTTGTTVLVGVVMVGRPVARSMDDGWTLEVTRCCTDGTRNAPSMLYGAAWRASAALGYRRLVTYVLASETGTTLRAAGWRELYRTKGGSWDTPSRRRADGPQLGQKVLWEVRA